MNKRISTIAHVEAARPIDGKQTEYPDTKVAGLALRVTPAGKKMWSMRFRTAEGKQQRISLGTFPAVTLSDARTAGLKALGSIAGGADPAKEKRAAKAAALARQGATFADLAEAYFEDATLGRHRPNGWAKRESTIELERGYYDREVKPEFGDKEAATISRRDVQQFIDRVSKKTKAGARMCRNLLRQVFNYGIRREFHGVEKNPAALVDLPSSKSRERVLSDDELKAVWHAAAQPTEVDKLWLSPLVGMAMMLSMVTLQRGGEVVGMDTRELDLKAELWTIPGDRTKNHRIHVVPLSSLAVTIIERALSLSEADEEEEAPKVDRNWRHVFPSPRTDTHLTRHALSRAMKRIAKLLKIPDVTPHDLRRTGSTNITGERIGTPRFHVSRVLNQASDTGGASAVTGVYDRNEYLAEKRKALDAWAVLLAQVVGETVTPGSPA